MKEGVITREDSGNARNLANHFTFGTRARAHRILSWPNWRACNLYTALEFYRGRTGEHAICIQRSAPDSKHGGQSLWRIGSCTRAGASGDLLNLFQADSAGESMFFTSFLSVVVWQTAAHPGRQKVELRDECSCYNLWLSDKSLVSEAVVGFEVCSRLTNILVG